MSPLSDVLGCSVCRFRYTSTWMAKTKRMKVTTVRFGEDLWAAIAAEAEQAGVSASQFIREAALARAAASAGTRGEFLFSPAFGALSEMRGPVEGLPTTHERDIRDALAALNRALAGDLRSDAEALRAESEQTQRTAARARDRARKTRTKQQD